MKNVWKVFLVSVVIGTLFKPLLGMESGAFPSVTIHNTTMFPMKIFFKDQERFMSPGESLKVPTGQELVMVVEDVAFTIGDEALDASLASSWNVALQVIDTSTPFYRALSERLARSIPVCKYVRLRLWHDSGDCFCDHSQDVIGAAELTNLIALLERSSK